MKALRALLVSLLFGVLSSCSFINVSVESITLNETSLTLNVGDYFSLSATVKPDNATNKNVTWSVNNDHVTVNEYGLVKAQTVGQCTVYAKSKENTKIGAKCSITVKAATVLVNQIILNKNNVDLMIGEKETLTASVLPTNAANKNITWSSDDTNVATVNGGVITAVGEGNTKIYATAKDGSGVKQSCDVIVGTPILVESIKILKNSAEISHLDIYVDSKETLTADVQPTTAYKKEVVWSVANPAIASISEAGLVKGLSEGNTTITAKNEFSNISKTITVTVAFDPEKPAYIPSVYYGDYYDDDFSWNNGADLKEKLAALMNSKRVNILGYNKSSTNWATNTEADRTEYDFEYLDVVYDDDDMIASNTFKGWQREHAFPATLMTGITTGNAVDSDTYKHRANDFQNLFAAYSSANGSRGNKNLGRAEGATSSIGDCKYDSKNFEPNDKDKGRLARTLIYMSTMYGSMEFEPLSLKEEYVEYTSGVNPQAHGNKSTLVEWAQNFMVDRLEVQHNDTIANSTITGKKQGNRNCFVDYPDLVDYIYGEKQNQSGKLKYLKPSVYTLDMYSNEQYYNFAIKTAKRVYTVGDTFDLGKDLTLVNVKKNNSYANDSNQTLHFESTGVEQGHVFQYEDADSYVITLKPSANNPLTYSKTNIEVKYTITLNKPDPVEVCDFKHTLGSGTATSGEFCPIKDNAGVNNSMTFEGVNFNVKWNKGSVGSFSSTKGTTFGSSTTPVETIIFETASNFTYGGNSYFDMIYLSGVTTSGKTAKFNIYINDSLQTVKTINYSSAGKQSYGYKFTTKKSGKIKFEITNITGAIYIHTLAIRTRS